MNSKFSNQDLINATLEIYNGFDETLNLKVKKIDIDQKIKKNKSPLVLTKEVKDKKHKNSLKNIFKNKEKLNENSISNKQRLDAYKLKKSKIKKNKPVKKISSKVWSLLKLNKIIKFENNKYLLLHKIKNSDLKIIKMKSPNL